MYRERAKHNTYTHRQTDRQTDTDTHTHTQLTHLHSTIITTTAMNTSIRSTRKVAKAATVTKLITSCFSTAGNVGVRSIVEEATTAESVLLVVLLGEKYK